MTGVVYIVCHEKLDLLAKIVILWQMLTVLLTPVLFNFKNPITIRYMIVMSERLEALVEF